MHYDQLRTEQQMMQELALVAVKTQEHFIEDGSQYSLPICHGYCKTFNVAFLDIRFIEREQDDCVMKFIDPDDIYPPGYCLLSELEAEYE